jgi:hypothetical protein
MTHHWAARREFMESALLAVRLGQFHRHPGRIDNPRCGPVLGAEILDGLLRPVVACSGLLLGVLGFAKLFGKT